MLTIKNAADIEKMKAAGRLTEDVLKLMAEMAKPGVTTEELDKAAEELIRSRGGSPSCLGYNGYPKTICTSVNEQVVHGIPGKYRLKDGDIVSCDVVAKLDVFNGYATRTLLIGDVPEETRRLVKVTEECFFEGLKFARVGYRISDISAAIQKHAESNGYGVVRDMIGHGIGREMHESPDVPNYVGGRYGRGIRLIPGMTIAIEPMINMGTWQIKLMPDGWTAVTADGKPSAHYENTVAITDGDPIILTLSEDNYA